jgi:hypothetical protein
MLNFYYKRANTNIWLEVNAEENHDTRQLVVPSKLLKVFGNDCNKSKVHS